FLHVVLTLILTGNNSGGIRTYRSGDTDTPSTPAHSCSNRGRARRSSNPASQCLHRYLQVLRKHPLARAPAPPSRQRARPRQWLQVRVSSWDLLFFLSFRYVSENASALRAVPNCLLASARNRDGTFASALNAFSHHRRGSLPAADWR